MQVERESSIVSSEESGEDERRPLTHLETVHVYSVIRGTMSRLGLVGVIMVDPQVQAQQMTQNVGEEISKMIAEQKALEQRFQQLIEEQHSLRGMVNKAKLKENQAEVTRVAEQLRNSTMQLCRNLKENPNVAENIAKVASERQSLQALLSRTLDELQTLGDLRSVRDLVVEEEEQQASIHQTIERERQTTAEVRQLKQALKQERNRFKEEMRSHQEALATLKEDLRKAKARSELDAAYTARSLAAQNGAQRRLEGREIGQLQKQVQELQQAIRIEEDVNATIMAFQKKRSTFLQNEALRWSQKFESDVAAKDKDTDTLKATLQKDLQRLQEVNKTYEFELQAKNAREGEKLSREYAELFQDEAVKERMTRCATMIQSLWRGHKAREAAKSKKKKKGKGKGKKKK
ncbi:unnamed protein product [Pedinophyceae sp. YPF-701]|nr:unnamed protein product [Pedinophyceae sp. YPF-701]